MKFQRACRLLLMVGFLLGVHNGYIALWNDTDPKPVRVFPYRCAMLPEADRVRLESGIRIEEESTLHSLLEDYLS